MYIQFNVKQKLPKKRKNTLTDKKSIHIILYIYTLSYTKKKKRNRKRETKRATAKKKKEEEGFIYPIYIYT